jgi:transitional endoplasmic reticulum ATPase
MFPGQYGLKTSHFILHQGSEEPARELILSAGIWANTLHDEILVFNQGFWYKDPRLWQELQKADWKDVILDHEFKEEIRKDIYGFFRSEQVYKELSIPWKVRPLCSCRCARSDRRGSAGSSCTGRRATARRSRSRPS